MPFLTSPGSSGGPGGEQEIECLETVPSDFNGDGYGDLAIGAPGEDFDEDQEGIVHVIYGSADGLAAVGNERWSQNGGVRDEDGDGDFDLDLGDLIDTAEPDDQFGAALVTGDFNNDGYADLAVGVPYEDFPEHIEGVVNVIYGSADGLKAAGNEHWTQHGGARDNDGDGIFDVFLGDLLDESETVDLFGSSLAAGDLNGDGYADLAVGVPRENIDDLDAGAAQILYGSADGLTAAGNELWTQDGGLRDNNGDGVADLQLGDLLDEPQFLDEFAYALTISDFDQDGYADLAVGVPDEDLFYRDSGIVHIIYGSSAGLTAQGNEFWSRGDGLRDNDGDGVSDHRIGDLLSIAGFDEFGRVLTAGDYNRDGYADLAIGVPYDDRDLYSRVDAGSVSVVYGSAEGLTAAGNELWTLDTASRDNDGDGLSDVDLGDILSKAYSGGEDRDEFGTALDTGDFNFDGYADLAVGAPADDFADWNDGAAHIIFGTGDGLSAAGNELWSLDGGVRDVDGDGESDLNLGDIIGDLEAMDDFGEAVAVGDHNGDGYSDLAVGDPDGKVNEVSVGAVSLIYGASDGLTAEGNNYWSQDGGQLDSDGNGAADINLGDIIDQPEFDDDFGEALE